MKNKITTFSRYEKIPCNLSNDHLTEKAQRTLNKLKWVVAEKVHGANFCFIYENKQLKFAKRKTYLTFESDFFGFQRVVSNFEDRIYRLFEQLSSKIKNFPKREGLIRLKSGPIYQKPHPIQMISPLSSMR